MTAYVLETEFVCAKDYIFVTKNVFVIVFVMECVMRISLSELAYVLVTEYVCATDYMFVTKYVFVIVFVMECVIMCVRVLMCS